MMMSLIINRHFLKHLTQLKKLYFKYFINIGKDGQNIPYLLLLHYSQPQNMKLKVKYLNTCK